MVGFGHVIEGRQDAPNREVAIQVALLNLFDRLFDAFEGRSAEISVLTGITT